MSLTKAPYYVLLVAIGSLLVVLPQIDLTAYVQSTITSKFIVFAYSCIIILSIGCILFVFSKPKAIRISRSDIALLLLVVYITINRYVVQPDFGFSLRFMELLGLGVLYAVLRIFPLRGYVWLLLAIVVSGILQSIYGNLQLLGYYPSNHSGFNITGSFFNPGPYAGFLAVVWPVALGMYLFRAKIIALVSSGQHKGTDIKFKITNAFFHYIPPLGIVTIMVVLPATRSRAAWLAVLTGSIVMLIYKYGILKRINSWGSIKRIWVAIVAIIVLVMGLYGVYHFKKGSADGRMLIWKVSTNIIKENPVFGVGFDRFKAHYMDAQAEYFVSDLHSPAVMVADNTYYAFNEPLQFVVENGLFGMVLAMTFMFLLFKIRVTPEKNELKILGLSVLLTVLVFGMFSYPVQILPIKIVCVTTLALLVVVEVKKYDFFSEIKGNVWGGKLAVVITASVLLLYSYPYMQSMGAAFLNWKRALDTYNYGLYEDSVEEFEKTYPTLHKDGDFLMNYGKALVMAGEHERAVKILEQAKHHLNTTIMETAIGDAHKALGNYSTAEAAYRHAANMIPHRFYPPYLLAKMYDESGQAEKAKAKAREILDKEVKVPSTAIREIRSEMEKILEKPLGYND